MFGYKLFFLQGRGLELHCSTVIQSQLQSPATADYEARKLAFLQSHDKIVKQNQQGRFFHCYCRCLHIISTVPAASIAIAIDLFMITFSTEVPESWHGRLYYGLCHVRPKC